MQVTNAASIVEFYVTIIFADANDGIEVGIVVIININILLSIGAEFIATGNNLMTRIFVAILKEEANDNLKRNTAWMD